MSDSKPDTPVVTIDLKPGEVLSDQQLRVLAVALASATEVKFDGHPSHVFSAVRDHATAIHRFLTGGTM